MVSVRARIIRPHRRTKRKMRHTVVNDVPWSA